MKELQHHTTVHADNKTVQKSEQAIESIELCRLTKVPSMESNSIR